MTLWGKKQVSSLKILVTLHGGTVRHRINPRRPQLVCPAKWSTAVVLAAVALAAKAPLDPNSAFDNYHHTPVSPR